MIIHNASTLFAYVRCAIAKAKRVRQGDIPTEP